jgi:hyperosmotically inducible protein
MLFVLTAALTIGAAGSSVAADTGDAWITMKTKIALLTTEGVHATALNVDTTNGAVTLHGKVESEAEKAKAESVAKGIQGVKNVKNLLQVVPPSAADSVAARDDELQSQVERAFKNNKTIDDSGIKVASVNKGVVLLTGRTDNMSALLKAVEAAKDIKGVKRVSSDVVVKESNQ